MNERVNELRKALGLTLEKFGERLGVTKTAISNIEKGNRSVTDQMFKSIIREFNVNEPWFRNGEGDMFVVVPEEEEIFRYTQQLLENEDDVVASLIKNTVAVYQQLDPASKEVIQESIQKVLERTQKKDQP